MSGKRAKRHKAGWRRRRLGLGPCAVCGAQADSRELVKAGTKDQWLALCEKHREPTFFDSVTKWIAGARRRRNWR
jgi:hypothetical protein